MVDVPEKKPTEGLASLQIPKEVDARLEAWCSWRSKVKRTTVTRLIERFLGERDAVKTMLLGEEDEGMEEAYAQWLEGMAKAVRDRAKEAEQPSLVINGLSPRQQQADSRSKSPGRREV